MNLHHCPLIVAFAGAIAALPAQNPCGTLHLVGLPMPASSTDTRLMDVCAFSATDIWAVGMQRRQIQGQTHSLAWILHWDGTRFSEVPCPSPAIPGGRAWCELNAIAGTSPNDIWAAGHYERRHPNNGHVGPQIFLLHWDGATWTQVPEPLPQFSYMASSSGSRVQDILAHTSNDVEFFGFWSGDQTTGQGALTAHWDGNSVTVTDVVTPTVGSAQRVWTDVDLVPPNDYWAVTSLNGGPGYNPYVARKNGGSWVQLTIPTLPITYYQMSAVGALASNDVWMAGSERTLNPSGPTQPYVVHWDGSAWTRRPTTGFVQEFLTLASNDVWAFGTTIERWNGSSWTLVADYRATLDAAQTVGAVAVNGCDLWGVGTQWASANGPPVAGLAVHVGSASAGAAVLRGPCNTPAHAHGIVPLTTPRVGRAMRVNVGDPFAVTGLTGAWLTAWAWAFGAGPLAPCGVVLPGLGLGGGAIEVLLDGSAVFVSSMSWNGSPLGNEHSVLLPAAPGLAGLQIRSQAVLLGGNGLVATNALDLTIGF